MFPALGLLRSRGALAVWLGPVHHEFRLSFYTWALGAVMRALIMASVYAFCDIERGSSMAASHTIKLWIGLIYLYLQSQSFNQLVQKLQDLANQNLIYQTISSANRIVYSAPKAIISTPYPTLCITDPRIAGPAEKDRIQLLFRTADTSPSLIISHMPIPWAVRWHPFHAQSTLGPFPDAISVLTPTPEYLSTGPQRLMPEWWTCCEFQNLVNPNLAPERKCPIYSHVECDFCGTEIVP